MFDKGAGGGIDGLRPVKFSWRSRDLSIKEVTYLWETSEGVAKIAHFSVTDGESLYELAYNQSTMQWTLENVE
ncbi:MAG: hypothetical protein IME98_02315 [Proteobacteria bacterium]|nr:hypothetical protein [Pseudomonadota bacterium]